MGGCSQRPTNLTTTVRPPIACQYFATFFNRNCQNPGLSLELIICYYRIFFYTVISSFFVSLFASVFISQTLCVCVSVCVCVCVCVCVSAYEFFSPFLVSVINDFLIWFYKPKVSIYQF